MSNLTPEPTAETSTTNNNDNRYEDLFPALPQYTASLLNNASTSKMRVERSVVTQVRVNYDVFKMFLFIYFV